MSQLSTPQMGQNGAWHSLSVQDFFSAINWDNKPIQKPLPTVTAGKRTVNPSMTVSDFFGAIPWEGEIVIAAPAEISLSAPETDGEDDLTLDDFSGLF